MDRRETAALLNYAATLDSRLDRAIADPDRAARIIDRWAKALADIPTAAGGWDAMRAVRRYYEQPGGDRSAQFRAIEPHDVLAAWAPHRRELLNQHTDPLPTTDPDDVVTYRAELLATRAAVATGQTPPAAYRAELNPGTQHRLAALTAGIGTPRTSPIPPDAAAQLARYRPRSAAREATLAAGSPDPLGAACPWCHAKPGEPCRGGFRPNGKGRASRRDPHPSRLNATRATRATESEADA
jgi:hypothetical protein